MARKGNGAYPPDWPEIAQRVKEEAGWRCARCGVAHGPVPNVLTVHHLDGNKGNCAWWNLAVLDQRCHLSIQARVVMARVWAFEHSAWFRPFVAGWTAANLLALKLDRETATRHADALIALHQGRMTREDCLRAVAKAMEKEHGLD